MDSWPWKKRVQWQSRPWEEVLGGIPRPNLAIFSCPLPRLPRRSTAQGELTPELIRTAQGWWDWDLGHREFPQSARGASGHGGDGGWERGWVRGSVGWVGARRPSDCGAWQAGARSAAVAVVAAVVVVVVVVVAGVRCAARLLRSASSRCTLGPSARTHQTHRPAGPATFSPNPQETW